MEKVVYFPILATEASIPGGPLQPTGVGTGHFRMTTANDAAMIDCCLPPERA
ncbi:hypothetical protein NTGBS_1150019 [Candidatus Nitrotoga sp. BS]|uniref:hypothetical protein n=1 Tax=Candidatus Nitrotoga sp. BS TaxID=2890408 RepID=UPI001EF19B93|nr:hypothetical protein [Candidatus Nitrotoga sp. BS]CAH1190278.1 hypothetical protein NTGBS_1150019 [Candidatus Nitrotoga sp. BS]